MIELVEKELCGGVAYSKRILYNGIRAHIQAKVDQQIVVVETDHSEMLV